MLDVDKRCKREDRASWLVATAEEIPGASRLLISQL